MKNRYFIHFQVTPDCMQAGLRDPGADGPNDVLDNLVFKLRQNPGVREMLERVQSGELDCVMVGVGRQTDQ